MEKLARQSINNSAAENRTETEGERKREFAKIGKTPQLSTSPQIRPGQI
jgi:hypothetical protein